MRKAGAALSALALSACAHHPRPAPKPISTAPGSTAAARPLPGRICTVCGCRAPVDLHRQYCDERRHRYYYFDPGKKQYFWETGEPK